MLTVSTYFSLAMLEFCDVLGDFQASSMGARRFVITSFEVRSRTMQAKSKVVVGTVMAPFPDMSFPIDWKVIDVENDAIIWQLQNAFPKPFDKDGKPFMFPNISRVVYDGDMLFKEEQDWYNPALYAPKITKAWRAAGGVFKSPEKLFMHHDKKHPGKATKSKL